MYKIEINCSSCGIENYSDDDVCGNEDGDRLYCPSCDKSLRWAAHTPRTSVNQARWIKVEESSS